MAAALALALAGAASGASAQQGPCGPSFVDRFDTLNTSRWYVSDGWANGDYQNCLWSKSQVSISDGILHLGYGPQPSEDRDYACSEIQTRQRYGYGIYEARMKTAAGPGLNSSLFSYVGPTDKQPHDEIDFEILGKDASQVQLNYYADGKGGHETLVPVPGGADAGFNDYAFVWEEGRIRWYINGELVEEASDPEGLPEHTQKIFLTLWGSDSKPEWLGRFQDPGSVQVDVDWVAFTAPGDDCQFPESIACTLSSKGD
ncbi:glycoside hydrolase family 16 protein [Consotaella sp. CSK11QG-6]